MKTSNRFPRKLRQASRGQALVLLAISFFALLAFIGLVTDVGSVYVSYTQLQRAVDAAAIAAANNIKNPQATYAQRKTAITEAAREMLSMHQITGVSDLQVFLCNDSGLPADFQAMCPVSGQAPRKLAYVEATQDSPVYFLHIFGVESVPLHASAVGETAAVDLVLVFDTSESMGVNTTGYDPRDFDPSTCNTNNNCYPLRTAKDAAKSLVGNLFNGYDQVAIVTFNYRAQRVFDLSTDINAALAAIDTQIVLHDDAPADKVRWTSPNPNGVYKAFNPINPEDRDGNGADPEPGITACTDANGDMWDDTTGNPCDRNAQLDAFDWNDNGIWGEAADAAIAATKTQEGNSLLSTCSGCGIRVASDTLAGGGRQDSVWVIVFLSDGVANLSDDHNSSSDVPASFRYGFCGASPTSNFWSTYCIDPNTGATAGRKCIDADSTECPPGTTATTTSPPYSVEDYAMDMVDRAGLLTSTNAHEPHGEDIIMYSIGLGSASAGENLLRYMANVGKDGSRANDPCAGIDPLHSCGNYYYAPNASYLQQIFENIASRVFSKISR